MRFTLGVLALLLGWAAVLQLNDVDPILWIAVYGGAAVACGLAALNVRVPRVVSVVYAVGAAIWAGFLAWRVFVAGDVQPMFESSEQTGILGTEEGREMIGLIIVAAATGLVSLVNLSQKVSVSDDGSPWVTRSQKRRDGPGK